MESDSITLKNGKVDILKNGNIAYFKVHGEYLDEDVFVVIKYLERFFDEVGGPTIRIFDATSLDETGYKLSPRGISSFKYWTEKVKMRWPGNVAYFIADKPSIFGMSRMYELQASDDLMPLHVVRKFDDLPEELKRKIKIESSAMA